MGQNKKKSKKVARKKEEKIIIDENLQKVEPASDEELESTESELDFGEDPVGSNDDDPDKGD